MAPKTLTEAEKVKAVRKALRLTQQQFATATGVDAMTISRYERGKFEPKPEFWESVAQLQPAVSFEIPRAPHTTRNLGEPDARLNELGTRLERIEKLLEAKQPEVNRVVRGKPAEHYVQQLREILESPDTQAIDAVTANLEMFHDRLITEEPERPRVEKKRA
jgi:transcriptional regulator with XRE-family HTH domain